MNTLLALALVLAGPRNIFQYVEDPRPPQRKAAVAAPAPVVITAPPAAVAVENGIQPPPTFDFPYRYIGSFGPEAHPIAVFVGETVVTARIGDIIGDAIVVRDIGLERVIVSRGDIAKSIALAD
jgi:hypothetical protein